jgi:hypothetical protein
MKRILSIVLIAVMMLSLVACSNKHSQRIDGSDTSVVMPDGPTDPTAQMPYNQAYETLTDITESVTMEFASMMSSQVPETPSITEFTTNEEFQNLVKRYGDVGRISDIECSLDENGFKYTYYWSYELPASPDNRYFFLASPEYNAQTVTMVDKIVYSEEQDTMYVLLKNTDFLFARLDRGGNVDNYAKKVAENSKATYQIVAMNASNFTEKVEHIVFVDPKPIPACREDINVSVIDFDTKYADLPLINPYANPAVGDSIYSFPSTIKPTENKIELITSSEMMSNLLDTYSNIVNREEDCFILEPLCVYLQHRMNGLELNNDSPLLHMFVSAPSIDPQCAIRTGDVRYDDATKTAYIHIEYNGMPTTQYEAWSDHEAIETEAQAKYVMVSAAFYKLDEYPIENVTIVLPDSTTVPNFNK